MEDFIKDIKSSGLKLNQAQLLPLLQRFQNKFGYIDIKFIEELSKILNIPAGKIYGIASFYNQFRFSPRGKYHIEFCSGASCHIKVKEDLKLEVESHLNQKTNQGKDFVSVDYIPCMGACAQGPVVAINGKYYTKLNIMKLRELLNNLNKDL